MKMKCLIAMLVVFALAANSFGDVNILVIGSTHSFSESEGDGGAFHAEAVADRLRDILAKDPKISGTKNVVFEDIYRKKSLETAVGGGGKMMGMEYRCYTLAQYFVWPEGREQRRRNLRGEGKTKWNVVVIVGDPYVLANMPGVYAEGVHMVADEVRKGTAKPLLLMPWPDGKSSFKAAHVGEIVYRVGNTAGIRVAPAGYAWDTLVAKDKSPEHPTPDGAYLGAATVYSELTGRNAASSEYRYKDSLAQHAFKTVGANRTKTQYAGKFDFPNPFAMKYVTNRSVTYNHTGTSSENGIKGALEAAIKRCKVGIRKTGPKSGENAKIDFNYGRANSMFEPQKRYKVAPDSFGRSYGFAMQDQSKTAATTMLYGIDKRFRGGSRYDDGTDLGIAYDMIRQGEVPSNIRCVPIRLMWAKLHDADGDMKPLRDRWHMSRYLDEASGTFMYTLLSGRCPVGKEPGTENQETWRRWLGRKIGYETAWRMSHLQARVPGFCVLPSGDSKTVAPTNPAELTVQFRYRPTSDVTVTVSVDKAEVASVKPTSLTFTPENHATAQKVTVAGAKVAADTEFGVVFDTKSRDEVFDGLRDSWTYTATATQK